MPKRTHDGVKKRCGCSKRQWPKCSHPWWFTFRFRRKEYRYSLDKLASVRNEPAPTSKSDAIKWRDRLRNEIRFGTFTDAAPPASTSDARLTVADVVKEYRSRYVNIPGRRLKAKALFDVHLDLLLEAQVPAAHGGTIKLSEKPIADVVKADVEAVREGRRALLKNRPLAKGGECGINRLLSPGICSPGRSLKGTQPSRYLQSTPFRLQRALEKLEGGGHSDGSNTEAGLGTADARCPTHKGSRLGGSGFRGKKKNPVQCRKWDNCYRASRRECP